MLQIRRIQKNEVNVLVDFIRDNWKSDHVFVKSREILDYQHLDGDYYNFWGAFDNEELIGILGYIPLSHFDAQLSEYGNYWGAIWKVKNDGKGYDCVGISLRETLIEECAVQTYGTYGLSKVAQKINKYLGYPVELVNQYYIANREMSHFNVCVNPHVYKKPHEKVDSWTINYNMQLENVLSFKEAVYKPYKSITYFKNKYANHPIYKYNFWGIYNGLNLINVWVVRRHVVNGHSIYRIIDVLGDLKKLPDLTEQIQEKLRLESCEYIDCINYGVESQAFQTIGFVQHDVKSEETIIPNYFEPFEKKNVPIYFSVDKIEDYTIFKGDSDQDRPNVL